MGYYATTCGTCGGPAIFFSIGSMWIDCSTCRRRKELCELLVAKAQHERQEQMRRWDEENTDREFKILQISFPWPPGMDGDAIFERVWRDFPYFDLMNCGWDDSGRTFDITLFEKDFEHRAGLLRLLADMGAVPTEQVVWI